MNPIFKFLKRNVRPILLVLYVCMDLIFSFVAVYANPFDFSQAEKSTGTSSIEFFMLVFFLLFSPFSAFYFFFKKNENKIYKMIYYFFSLPFIVVFSIFIMLNFFSFVFGLHLLMSTSLLAVQGILLLLIFIQLFVTIRIIYLKERINKEIIFLYMLPIGFIYCVILYLLFLILKDTFF